MRLINKRQLPTRARERKLAAAGYHLIAGIDEVGRGALAGPVVAAAVILPCRLKAPWLKAVRDSKQLTSSQRETLFPLIRNAAVTAGIGIVPAEEIDTLGIVPATRQAMCLAVNQLSCPPDFLLIDALELPLSIPQESLIKGDCLCFSISCASILAKVTRDRLMEELDALYLGYGFKRHKGYGTKEHLASLRQWGPSSVHRRSFAPVGELLR